MVSLNYTAVYKLLVLDTNISININACKLLVLLVLDII